MFIEVSGYHMMSTKYTERLSHVEDLLLISNRVIDTAALKEACSFGIPDSLRPLCWRLFHGYLPREREKWPSFLKERRAEYQQLVENLVCDHINYRDDNSNVDHPLSDGCNSQWAQYFKDNEVLLQIDRDVRRLHPAMDFFQRSTPYPLRKGDMLNQRLNADSFDPKSMEESSGEETHWECLRRILFVYANVHRGIKYVQGMNELIGPLYYVLATDSDASLRQYAEADSFFLFQNLMAEMKDYFIRSLDNSNCGIESLLNQFYRRFEQLDAELYSHLVLRLEIKPQFYAFRWISLLLSQEFTLPDVLILWDHLFSCDNRIESCEFLCLAMLETARDELLAGDFGSNVRLLQNYSIPDVSVLIAKAVELKSNAEPRSRSDSSVHKSRFWNRDRFSAMVTDARVKLSSYARAARRQNAQSDGAISYSEGN